MPNEITKPLQDKVVRGHRITVPPLQARIAAANAKKQEKEFTVKPNRIVLLLDLSGSMDHHENGKGKIEHLRDAVENFTNCLDSATTSVCAVTFPIEESLVMPPTSDQGLLRLFTHKIHTLGSTPLGEAMCRALCSFSITSGIIISDGAQTDGDLCFSAAKEYKEADVPLDCLHIGHSENGEETLKEIAETTGGKYIKFSNVGNFAKALKYLQPAYRGLLNSGDAARLLGAEEVI